VQEFSHLYNLLDQTNSTSEKVELLAKYFRETLPENSIWALALLCGRKPKRTVNSGLLRSWAAELAGIPDWLFEESYHTIGDLAETIALLIDQQSVAASKPLHEWMHLLKMLEGKTEGEKKQFIVEAWQQMDASERFVFNKLITGGFRVGVSQKLVEKALAKVTGIEASIIAHRLMGNWSPGNITFDELLQQEVSAENISQPYPFFLAYPLQDLPETLGNAADWFAEWKWDGIRGQIIVRGGEIFVWSRGEELITTKFPEYQPLINNLPDGTVLDAEIVCWKDGNVLPFQLLQTRISRKNLSNKQLLEAPAALIAYDVFEYDGNDVRHLPHVERRKILENIVSNAALEVLQISPLIAFDNWESLSQSREKAREMNSEGLMIKRKEAVYQVGRKRGDWWKWKLDPMSVDAVLIYAMQGHGRRANLYTDYTFAIWNNGLLVSFAKAYSGLTDTEIKEVDSYVKANTIEKFGPVRSVKANLVFEIGFEGIQKSSRHKSGVALRFPRILRWRKDKVAAEADQLETLLLLIDNLEKKQ
jgi:DNA ligase-1